MSSTPFTRVAIVNRGEPAMRLINAVSELRRQEGWPLRTIALYTDADHGALYVSEADESIGLGSPTFIDPKDGQPKSRYLDYGALEHALLASGAEAAWVGWGFVSEHAEFAALCDRIGVVFIGPPASVIRRLGDKISAKRLAENAGVPVSAWSDGPIESLEHARAHAARLGYPVIVKASAGGGGRGIRRVRTEADLEGAISSAQAEASKSFGDKTVYIERLIDGARHVEVQILADGQGNTWSLGCRDCTIQRKGQKVIEESPPPTLSEDELAEVQAAAVRLAKLAGYVNAGTVEFLFDPKARRFAFMEVNTRLQVEHPVTELVTGVDLVKLQLRIAAGGTLEGQAPRGRGHAVEVRLCAEDPDNAFMPAPGLVRTFDVAVGPGIRVDSGLGAGDTISPLFDSMIAKIIAQGQTRKEAMARLALALERSAIVIEGGTTNRSFLLELIGDPEVVVNQTDIGWLDRRMAARPGPDQTRAGVALIAAAIGSYELEGRAARAKFLATAKRGRPEVVSGAGRKVELEYRGVRYEVRVANVAPARYHIELDGARVEVEVEKAAGDHQRLRIGGRSYRVLASVQRLAHLVEVDGGAFRISSDASNVVRSPGPAVVVSIAVKEGDRVSPGDRLAVLEAMKTETALLASSAGVVRQVHVIGNTQVPAGAPLITIEPPAEGTVAAVERIQLTARGDAQPEAALETRQSRIFERLGAIALGWDVSEKEAQRLAAEYRELTDLLLWEEGVVRAEDGVLARIADVAAVAGAVEPDEDGDAAKPRAGQQLFLTYLRDIGGRGERLPEEFRKRLQRALAHYGVTSLEHTAALDDALYRMTVAQKRTAACYEPIAGILHGRLRGIEGLAPERTAGYHDLLAGLAAQRHETFRVVADAAREVHYRVFGTALHEERRARAYADAQAALNKIQSQREAEREESIEALVDCPFPLRSFLSRRFVHSGREQRRTLLETIARSYYRPRRFARVAWHETGGTDVLSADLQGGFAERVIAAHADGAEIDAALMAAAGAARDGRPSSIEIYAWRPGAAGDDLDRAAGEIAASIAAAGISPNVGRVVVSVASLAHELGQGDLEHFTFTRRPEGLTEDKRIRGVHPMIAGRIRLGNLAGAGLVRLVSPEDVYLFEVTGAEAGSETRLLGIAEVHDMTPVHDSSGKLAGLPELERLLVETLAGMRWYHSRRSRRGRTHWNRVVLFARQPLRLAADDLLGMVRKIQPHTRGLGLEAIAVYVEVPARRGAGRGHERCLEIVDPESGAPSIRLRSSTEALAETRTSYTPRLAQLTDRLTYPYELVRLLTLGESTLDSVLPRGRFVEHDLDPSGALVPVSRGAGENTAGIVAGVIETYTERHPAGMARVLLMGDPSREMGALAEAECRRILAALDLAEKMRVPLEWFALSAGARIAMDSGTENLDWVARVLKRIIERTQQGATINVVVNGINVGAQPYWNAEATMLMHTRGILIMTGEGAMVLTGKRALDYSGGVSADDNLGIGGFDHIMGPNGQAHCYARDVGEACRLLYRWYEHTYVAPGERFPRRARSSDPFDRDVCADPHGTVGGASFQRIGDIFSDATNPGRKKPFDIRSVLRSVVDRDHAPLERWPSMQDADTAVVWEAHIGGYPVCLLGIESRALPRAGFVPGDGPDHWSAGTLFPVSSKKVARALNSASGNRPAVILANLSGFDGSPESMRKLQLEYGAEIGRAVVNFDGPIVFCVISRYHGGAFVVFSNRLNENMEVAALAGAHASVIGGAPAAAVVFNREVRKRTKGDPRVVAAARELERLEDTKDLAMLRRLEAQEAAVYAEKLGEVAEEFDRTHSVERAQRVGSVDKIIPPNTLRPYLVNAIERGIAKTSKSAGPGRSSARH